MTKKTCYIFGAGEHYNLPPSIHPLDYTIAADGGYEYLEKYGITPDLIVGDFDSYPGSPYGKNVVALPKEKDSTDMCEAIQLGYEEGYRHFHIYGGVGGRLDHTLANIQCIANLAVMGARGFLIDKDCIITAIKNDTVHFESDAKGYISIFAHSDTVYGVYEKGLKYTLEDATLHNINPLGISNEFIGVQSSISVQKGTLIIVYPKNVFEI